MLRQSLCVLLLTLTTACNSVQRNAELAVSSAMGQRLRAGPGDTVVDIKVTKSLPNAFGKADLFGRTTDAGRIVVRYLGSQGKTARFARQDLVIESGETTMTRTPLIIPNQSTTNVYGTVDGTRFSGTATSNSYAVIGPRPTNSHAFAMAPVEPTVQEGRSIQVEGRTLTVLNVTSEGIEFSVQ
jgi:hypothetical protein